MSEKREERGLEQRQTAETLQQEEANTRPESPQEAASEGLRTLEVHGNAQRFHQTGADEAHQTEAAEARETAPEAADETADKNAETQAEGDEAKAAEDSEGGRAEAGDRPESEEAETSQTDKPAEAEAEPVEKAQSKTDSKTESKPKTEAAPEASQLRRAQVCARLLHRFLGKRNLLNISAALLLFQGLALLLLNNLWSNLPHQGLFAQSSFSAFLLSRIFVYALAFILPLILLTRLYPLPTEAYWGRRRYDGMTLGLTLLMGFPAALCFSSVNNLLNVLLLSLNLSLPSQGLPHSYLAQHWYAYPPLLIVAVLCPSILDELFFRGFVGRSLGAINSRFFRRLLQGLCYALFFCDPLYLATPFLLGLLLSKLRDLGHGLTLPIVLHFGFSLSQLFLRGAIPQFSLEDILSIPLVGYQKPFLMGILALLAALLLVFLYRFLRERLYEEGKLAGFHSGARAQIYGRNRYSEEAHKWGEKDRHYAALLLGEPPRLNWRFGLALIVWLLCLMVR